MLLKHAPENKLPQVYQQFHVKKGAVQQNFCSRVLLHWIKLVKYEGASSSKSVVGACCGNKVPSACVPALKNFTRWCLLFCLECAELIPSNAK